MITENMIFTDVDAKDQNEVFDFLSAKSVALGFVKDTDAVKTAFFEREAIGTTGMLDGFAIPHAKSSAIIAPNLMIIKLMQGIEWQSLDGTVTDSIIAMFIPEGEAGTTHLTLLSQVAKMLMKAEFRIQFKETKEKSEIVSLLSKYLKGDTNE